MKYQIQKTENIPAYLQLYSQVREDIVKKIYPYGSKLPSKRTMANELGLSLITVEHAYMLLCDEGYIESKERSGYFVIFRADAGFAAFAESEHFTRPLIPNHPHHDVPMEFPFSVIAKTMRAVISDFGKSILERSPNCGCIELREAIRLYLARSRSIAVDIDQIVIGAGSEYLYSLLVGLLGRKQHYAIESPSYKQIEQVYKALQAHYERLPLGTDGIVSSALYSCTADILHVSPYRSFPSGITATASKRHEYLHWAAANHRYLIEDDFESEFSVLKKTEETLFSASPQDNVLYINTFSKTISPSLRTGYLLLPHHLVSVFKEKMGFYSCTVPTYIQLVLAKLISNGDFERHINRVRRQKRKELHGIPFPTMRKT